MMGECPSRKKDEEMDEVSLCCLCGQTYSDRESLHEHFLTAHEDKPLATDIASSPEQQSTLLNSKSIESDSSEPRSVSTAAGTIDTPCLIVNRTPPASPDPHLGKIFSMGTKPLNYQNHPSINQNPRAYPCSYCRKSFTKTCNLNSHVKAVHNGVKAFECLECRKSFSRNSDLLKHIDAVHKGLRPYQCAVCQKQFSQKSSLKRHKEAVHEGIKPFQCVHCHLRFSSDVHLKRHIRAKHKLINIQSNSVLQPTIAIGQASST